MFFSSLLRFLCVALVITLSVQGKPVAYGKQPMSTTIGKAIIDGGGRWGTKLAYQKRQNGDAKIEKYTVAIPPLSQAQIMQIIDQLCQTAPALCFCNTGSGAQGGGCCAGGTPSTDVQVPGAGSPAIGGGGGTPSTNVQVPGSGSPTVGNGAQSTNSPGAGSPAAGGSGAQSTTLPGS